MMILNKKILTSILFVIISVVSNAQELGGGGEMPQPAPAGGPPNPPGFPIDDSLIFLVVAALIYGAYISLKLLKKKTHV